MNCYEIIELLENEYNDDEIEYYFNEIFYDENDNELTYDDIKYDIDEIDDIFEYMLKNYDYDYELTIEFDDEINVYDIINKIKKIDNTIHIISFNKSYIVYRND